MNNTKIKITCEIEGMICDKAEEKLTQLLSLIDCHKQNYYEFYHEFYHELLTNLYIDELNSI